MRDCLDPGGLWVARLWETVLISRKAHLLWVAPFVGRKVLDFSGPLACMHVFTHGFLFLTGCCVTSQIKSHSLVAPAACDFLTKMEFVT